MHIKTPLRRQLPGRTATVALLAVAAAALAAPTALAAPQAGPRVKVTQYAVGGSGFGAVNGTFGRVWLLSGDQFSGGQLKSVSPATGKVTVYRPATFGGDLFTAPAVDGQGNLWIGDDHNDNTTSLVRFNPRTGKSTNFTPRPCRVSLDWVYAASDGHVWAECNPMANEINVTTNLLRIAPSGTWTEVKALKAGPDYGRLTPGKGGAMWAVARNAIGEVGAVEITPRGHQSLFPDTSGTLETQGEIAGNGKGRIVEIADCVSVLNCTFGKKVCAQGDLCYESISSTGARTLVLVQKQVAGTFATAAPVMDAAGNVWVPFANQDGGKLQYFYEVTTKSAARKIPFSIPHPAGLPLTPAEFAQTPAAITPRDVIWVEERDPHQGDLLKVAIG